MPSILFWVGEPGGTGVYRCLGPGRALARAGWDVEFEDDGIDVTLDGRVRGDPDILVLCRTMGDYVPDAVRRIRAYGRTVVVFDVDDWFFGVPGYNPASRLPADLVDNMHEAMRMADLITCSTPELAEGYAALNRTVVLPNYLDPEFWKPFQHLTEGRDLRTNIHVGWAGAFHWRGGDLELLKPWIYEFLDRHPEVRFVAVGCRELLEWLGIDGLTTPRLPPHARTSERNRDLHPYQHLPAMLANLDIGLVPLQQNRFNRAKSWCKGMEYGAMGVPLVASPSPEYRKYVRAGINGFMVRGADWIYPLERILDNLPAFQYGAQRVADGYWIDDHIHLWVEAYAQARELRRAS